MASTEASRRASVASSSEMSFADSTPATKLLPKKEAKKEKPTGGVKLKKSIAKKTKPKDTESNGTNTAGATRSPSPSSPTGGVTSSAKTEGGDRPGTTKCKICSKPVENTHFDAHLKHCQDQKKADQKKAREAKKAKEAKAKAKEAEEGKEKGGDSDAPAGEKPTSNGIEKTDTNGDASAQATKKPPKKSAPPATKMTDGSKKSKKRKGDELDSTEKEPKKKKAKKAGDASAATAANTANGTSTSTPNTAANNNDPPKPKLPKPKGPVNVELQCGVALPNGGFCARSLTCKSHSMGAKRSVPGRSAPYDTLLQQYQKKNQAKQQKLALANQAIEHAAAEEVEGAEGATIDSEEEREAVMRAVTRGWGGMPLEQYFHMSSRRRYLAVRRREGLQQALAGGKLFAAPPPHGTDGPGPHRGSVSGGSAIGAGASPDLGGPDDTASRRASLAQALSGKPTAGGGASSGSGGGGGGPPSRKASVASVSGSVAA